MAAKGTSAGRKSLDRAMSMAEAAPVLAPTPHSQLGASFQENEGGRSGGPSSSSRKPGRCVALIFLSYALLECVGSPRRQEVAVLLCNQKLPLFVEEPVSKHQIQHGWVSRMRMNGLAR